MIFTGDDEEILSRRVSQSGPITKEKQTGRIGEKTHFFPECVNELSHRRPCVSWAVRGRKLNLLCAKGF